MSRPLPVPEQPPPNNPFRALRETLGERLPRTPPRPAAEAAPDALPEPAEPPAVRGLLRLRRERAGHAGKRVTVVEGPGLEGLELETLARQAAKALGVGARVEAGALVLQGDAGERLLAWLAARGFTRVQRSN